MTHLGSPKGHSSPNGGKTGEMLPQPTSKGRALLTSLTKVTGATVPVKTTQYIRHQLQYLVSDPTQRYSFLAREESSLSLIVVQPTHQPFYCCEGLYGPGTLAQRSQSLIERPPTSP